MNRIKKNQHLSFALSAIGFAGITSALSAEEITPQPSVAVVSDYVASVPQTLPPKATIGQAQTVSYAPAQSQLKLLQQGVASYYGPGFHGRRTANGEKFDMNALTAAHRTLPFGTKLKVTNLRNGQSTIVRVNDRGPYAKGRILDLSGAAAKQIGSIHSGTATIKIEVVTQ